MASQLYGVSGRKLPSDTVDIINSQTPYLPTLYKQKADDEYRMKTLDLQEKQLNQEKELGQEAIDVQKRQNRVANLLGVGNLGLKAGMGLYADKGLSTATTPVASTLSKTTPEITNYLFGGTGGGVSGETPSIASKLMDTGTWGEALTGYEPWAGGAAGALASRFLTKKDDSAAKKGLIGAGVGAGVSALASGGDIYKSVIGGIFGAAGGIL
jgi:hypothetical protein